MPAKLQSPPRGGSGGSESVSALRKKIAALALPHVEKAVQTIVEALEADRDTVRLQAATTLLELAETGGEGLGEESGESESKTKLLLVSGPQVNEALKGLRDKGAA